MNSRRRSDDLLNGRLVELPETIRERSGGVDDTLGEERAKEECELELSFMRADARKKEKQSSP